MVERIYLSQDSLSVPSFRIHKIISHETLDFPSLN